MTAQMQRTQRSGWPVLRTPRWMFAGAAVLVAGLVIAAIPHTPSNAQRVADLQSFVNTVNSDVGACAYGIDHSTSALQAIETGRSHDVKTAVAITSTASNDCSPGVNMTLDDLVQYQVSNSLTSFHLDTTVNDLVTWAFPLAQNVDGDMGKIAAAQTPAEKAAAEAALSKDKQALDAQRAKIDKAITAANKALSSHVALPYLPD